MRKMSFEDFPVNSTIAVDMKNHISMGFIQFQDSYTTYVTRVWHSDKMTVHNSDYLTRLTIQQLCCYGIELFPRLMFKYVVP